MPKYYLSGTSPKGRRVTHQIEANSVADAQRGMIDRGWSDVVAHTDNIAAINHIEVPDNPFSPEEMIRLGGMSQLQFFFLMLRKLYAQSLQTALIGVAGVAFGLFDGGWLPLVVGLALLLFPLLLAVLSAVGSKGKRRYDALVAAAAWYRWDEVERLLPLQSASLPIAERAYREAQILAGRGDIQAALQRHDGLIAGHNIPEWFVCGRHAVLYLIANKAHWAANQTAGTNQRLESPYLDDVIRKYEEAIELSPEQSVTLIDLAKTVLKYRRDARRARELLEQSQDLVTVELAMIYREYVNGIIALEENSADEAVELISEFQEEFSHLSGSPDAQAAIDESRAFLVLAYALAGNDERAHQQFRLCEPRLIATNELELLARCRKALGLNQR
ncbi:MAG: hypothetical protein JWN70_3680 [Planctomycetaceae bacterium]|nr:hypothetical protein [Planctomycetaceae bacterium]